MKKNIKVSVIIPIYNRSALIENCIQSVLKQTLEQIEILCIDDGSTDDSADIVRKMMMYEEKIKLIQQENQGAGIARNNGMKKAQGKYIAFLDSDDFYLDTNALSDMINKCEKENAYICGAIGKLYINNSFSDYNATDLNPKPNDNNWISFEDYQSDRGYCCFIYNRKWILEN